MQKEIKLARLVLKKWILENNFKIVVFNMIIIFLFLLRSAGYFQPYFSISVNFIVMFGLFLSYLLLGTRSRVTFFITLIFWLFAGVLQVLRINVWAERTGIYAFESLVFGVILFLGEEVKRKYS